jgi:hypothetical protein
VLAVNKQPRLTFYGSQAADLFTRKIRESFDGVLNRNMVTDPKDPNSGFISVSIDGRPWTETMWTRDAGVFLRELIMWGYLDLASLAARRLIELVRPNTRGFRTFPTYFRPGQPASGSELDGTAAILISLVLL